MPFWVRNYARSRVPDEEALTSQATADARFANNVPYLVSLIAEYVLLAFYLVTR